VVFVFGLVAWDVHGSPWDYLRKIYFGSLVPLWAGFIWALAPRGGRTDWFAAFVPAAVWGAIAAALVFMLGLVLGVNFKFAIGGSL
jgi:hypothetical protein